MKIVNQRGAIVTSEEFRRRLRKLVKFVANGIDHETVVKPGDLKTHAVRHVEAFGLNPNTKLGQAVGGAAMMADTLAAGLKEYEKRTGKSIPKEALSHLETKFAEWAAQDQSTQKPERGEAKKLDDLGQ
jgi:hypothetical protein